MRILVGYDGSEPSARALHGLVRAGLPSEARVLVVTAANPWPEVGAEAWAGAQSGIIAGEIAMHAIRRARELADEAAGMLRSWFPAWKVEAEAVAGKPAQVLLDTADAWGPHLLVVGSHGRSRLERRWLGSVSLRVLHHAQTDVRISRAEADAPDDRGARILLAYDGSEGSDKALGAVLARPWPEGTVARVLSVVDWRDLPSALLGPERRSIRDPAHESASIWIEEKAESVAERLVAKGIGATHDVRTGDPRRVILRESRAWKADSIFAGSRGLGAVDRFLIGSVSSALAARASCSVEIVRVDRRLPGP